MKETRTFISIDPGKSVRNQLVKLQEQLRSAGADIRWAKPENIHLTLAFLGNLSEKQIAILIPELEHHLSHINSFSLIVSGTGTFGKRNRPQVLWTGIEESGMLQHLYNRTNAAIAGAELEPDTKPFFPHLTLGRVKSQKNIHKLISRIEENKTVQIGKTEIKSVELMKSSPSSTGTVYSILHSFPLR